MIWFGEHDHARRISEAAGVVFNPMVDRCISKTRTSNGVEKLLGGVTYQNYTGASIQMHMAAFDRRIADRYFIWMVFDYPFGQLGCDRVFAYVPEACTAALEIDRRLGFKDLARIEGVFPEGACVILGMEREDCRWLDYKPHLLVIGSEG